MYNIFIRGYEKSIELLNYSIFKKTDCALRWFCAIIKLRVEVFIAWWQIAYSGIQIYLAPYAQW